MYKRYRGVNTENQQLNDTTSTGTSKSQLNEDSEIDRAVVEEVKRCWDIIDSQLGKNLDSLSLNRTSKYDTSNTSAWRTVRVFVSSTFTDFFNEREVLVKKVFPELKEWCEERNIQLIECDLRWGVPKDSNTRDTICACMEELDRCFEENDGRPFFLNLISERFGWVPTESEVPNDIRDQYNWVFGASITLMEILHGAYRTKNPNAAFFVRNADFIKDIPTEYSSKFVDNKPSSKQHLKVIKQKLLEHFPNQVYQYKCHLAGVAEVSGRQRVTLSGLDDFAENVIKWLKSAITRSYPDQGKVKELNQLEQEAEYHRLFMEKKSEFVIGRDQLVDSLLSYVKGEVSKNVEISESATSFVRDPEFWQSDSNDNMMMCVTGSVGHGKTTIMAKVVKEIMKMGIPVFYHFVGCTGGSRQTEMLVQRLVHTLTGQDIDKLLKETEGEPLEICMKVLKDELPKLRSKNTEIVIVIDGVNELVQYEDHKHLAWLPPKFPGKIRCIVSSANNHPPTLNRLKEHSCYMVDVGPITTDTAKDMITVYLGKYNKRLEVDQIDWMVSRPCAQNPIWVWLLMEELRIYGDYKTLTDKIRSISDSVENLLSAIITRLIKEDESSLLKTTLCLLATSRAGLSIQDIVNISGDVDKKEPIPLLYWAKIRRLLRPYIRFIGWKEHIVFTHSSISQAVSDNLLSQQKDREKFHAQLAKYFLSWCDDTMTVIESVPYHCKEAGMKDSLIEFLRTRKEAGYIPDYSRSRYFDNFRCKNLADPVIPANMPVVLCRSCSLQKSSFSPRFDRNKSMCVICGSFLFPSGKQVVGHYCHHHSIRLGQNKIVGKCVVCNRPVSKDKDGKVPDIAGMYGQLCTNCGFGFRNKQCCNV